MSLRVIVVDDERDRAEMVCEALEAAGFTVAGMLGTGSGLPAKVEELRADVIIVDIGSPDRDTLEDMRVVSLEKHRPVVMFADDCKPETISAAIEAGAAAYVVDGLHPDRVKPVVDVAVARFAQFRELRGQLDKAKASLAERKLIEKAKGILMKRRSCDEDEAFRLLRKMAMDQKVRLADVANKVIEAAEILG
jgi:response regulator NasT